MNATLAALPNAFAEALAQIGKTPWNATGFHTVWVVFVDVCLQADLTDFVAHAPILNSELEHELGTASGPDGVATLFQNAASERSVYVCVAPHSTPT